MAFPAIGLFAGIATVITSSFVALVGYLGTVVSKKIAIGTALGIFAVLGWVALQGAIVGMWIAMAWVMPEKMAMPTRFVNALLPPNTWACIQVLAGAKIARWVWDRQREWAKMTASS